MSTVFDNVDFHEVRDSPHNIFWMKYDLKKVKRQLLKNGRDVTFSVLTEAVNKRY